MKFRKAVAAGVGLLMLSQGALVPRRAQASFAFEVAATVGWALALGWTGGSLAAVTINHFFELKNAGTGKKVLRVAAAIFTGIGALILLDADDSAAGMAFSSLTADQAAAAGLSVPEWRAYESERMEISALAEQSVADAELSVGTEDLARFVEAIRSNWDQYSVVLLSRDAASAAQKLARASLRY